MGLGVGGIVYGSGEGEAGFGGLDWRNGRGTLAEEGLFWTLRETASRPSGSSEHQAEHQAERRAVGPSGCWGGSLQTRALGVSRDLGESSDFQVPSQQFCSRSGVRLRSVPGLPDAGSSLLRADVGA